MAGTYPVGVTRTPGETLALSTTVASLGIPPNVHQAILYNPSVDFRLHWNPRILDATFYDASASVGARYIDLTNSLLDRDTSTGTGSTMNSMTTSDFLYVCVTDVISGVRVTIGNTNTGSANTLKGEYWNGSWTNLSVTDNTSDATRTLNASATVTWTAPTDWLAKGFQSLDTDIANTDRPVTNGFWLRFSVVTASLDSSTSITELWTLNRDTNRGYFRAAVEYPISINRTLVGALEAILAAGTDTLQVTWVRTVY